MTKPATLALLVLRARDMNRLASFYSVLGFEFTVHQHGKGPEHLSAPMGDTVFEIYPAAGPEETTVATRLGFRVPSLAKTIDQLRALNVEILSDPSATPFGRRAVVKDFEGHKVELYEEANAPT